MSPSDQLQRSITLLSEPFSIRKCPILVSSASQKVDTAVKNVSLAWSSFQKLPLRHHQLFIDEYVSLILLWWV